MDRYNRLVQRMLPDVEYHQNRYARAVGAVLRDGDVWLDLGAGTRPHRGWIGPSAAELKARASVVVGCDLVVPHLRANQYLTTAVAADGAWLPLASERFDLVTANMVLEHLPEPLLVLKEIARVLRPGGRFVFVTPNLSHPAVKFLSMFVKRDRRRALAARLERRRPEHIFPTFYRANSAASIAAAARAVGLRLKLLERFSSYPMVRAFVPLTWLECCWIRLTALSALQALRSNIVGCLERDPYTLTVRSSRIETTTGTEDPLPLPTPPASS
ncbi:MAG TPA: class I SAM-dependent methyltransferase [Gemmatimonadales bacterium]|nr:class I SAM-dependent methyltransferase [Gemmatimonadales bacterium]